MSPQVAQWCLGLCEGRGKTRRQLDSHIHLHNSFSTGCQHQNMDKATSMGSATQTFGHATDLGFFSHSFRAAPNLCLMKAKPLQPLITTKGNSQQPPPQAHLRSLLTKLFPAVHALSSPGPDPNKARALYKPCNTFSLQPFPNFATCSAGMARASGHQAKFQLCLPGTLQDMLALRCSLKITDVTPLFCILQ